MSRSPTTHVASTTISVRFGPQRSARMPHPNEATTATTMRITSTPRASPSVNPTALIANRLMTAMAVLAGSV